MADYKGLNIRFRGDTTDASKALHILSAEAKNAQGNLTGIQNALKSVEVNGEALNNALKSFQLEQVGKQADAARGKFEVYGNILTQLRSKHAELSTEIADTKAQIDTLNSGAHFGDVSKSITDLEAHLNSLEEQERSTALEIDSTNQKMLVQEATAKSLAAAQQSLALNIAASQTGFGQFGADAMAAGTNLQSLGDAISNVGDKMTIVSGIVALTFGRKIVSSTEEFGNAIAQLGGYLEIEGSSLEHMGDLALKWGKDTQFSATEAAQAMNELAKGGMSQAQIEGGAMQATMELAAAGSLDMASAAEVAVQAIKTFGLEAGDASAIADALAGAANTSTAEVTELANGFKYVGGWASMAGWNINEVSGALALLSDHGLQSEMAGTALRNVMQRLAAPTNTAAKLMDAYGFSVRDSSGQMVSAVEVVRRLNDVFGKLGDAEKQEVLNKIFGARALPAAVALMNEGADALQGYIDQTMNAGYATEMAEHRMGDLGWALEYMRGEAETAAVNFGQALTPTIIEVAKSIEVAANWFNSLSDSEQTNIANMALFVVAAGPVLSIVGHLTSGIGGMMSTVGQAANVFSLWTQNGHDLANAMAEAVIPAMGDAAKRAELVAEKTEAMRMSMANLASGAAVGLALATVSEFVSIAGSLVDSANLVNKATNGIAESTHLASQSIAALSESGEAASENSLHFADVLADVQKGLQSTAQFADEMRDSLSELATNSALVDEYANQMKELSSQSELSASQQEQLKNAVERYNEITGAAIRVTEAQSGALSILPSQIDKVTDAYKRQAEQQAYIRLYNEAIEEQARNQEQLRKVTQEVVDASKNWTSQLSFGIFANAENAANIINLKQSMNGLKTSGDELAKSVEYWKSKIEESSTSSGEYQQMLESLDIAAKDTATAMSEDAEDYAETVSTASDDAVKALERANDKAYTARQRAYDREYKELQRQLDAEETAQQRAYDAEYDNLQKQLDSIYDARQSEQDAEYDAAQKHYDAIYAAEQKKLDAEYEQRSKAYDKVYKARQAAYKQEEEDLKKSLDARYDAREEAYDKRLNQLKKHNDKVLKEAKRAYDDETDAFKAETDRRVAALKAEYNEKLRLLELDNGANAIDEQIKSIQAQAKAEQDAIEDRKDAEKKAELERAVEQAKTRRQRADREKELDDYLAELAQKQREREREAQIESLKDQRDIAKTELADKKDALKAEYDARIEAIKKQRADELEVLKDAQDTEYDKLKESLDKNYAARKDHYDKLLQSLRNANSSALAAMQSRHSKELERLKESQKSQLAALKDSQKAQLEALKSANSAALKEMKNAQKAELKQLKESQSDQLKALKESQKSQMDAMKQAHQDQLQELKYAQQDKLTALKNSQKDMVDAMKNGGASMASTSRSTSNNVIDQYKQMGVGVVQKVRSMGANIKSALIGSKDSTKNITKSTADGATNNLRSFTDKAAGLARTAGTNYNNALYEKGQTIQITAANIAGGIEVNLKNPSNNSYTWGSDMLTNFTNGMVDIWNRATAPAVESMTSWVEKMLGHSKPEIGPLRDDDVWFYHMMQNLTGGIRRGMPELMAMVNDAATGVGDGLSGIDVTSELLENMRSGEAEIANQSRRMASIVQDSFGVDAHGSYSIGYDVKPMVSAFANGVHEALRGGVPQTGVTVIVREMNVRDESDIDKVSERLYQRYEQVIRRGVMA